MYDDKKCPQASRQIAGILVLLSLILTAAPGMASPEGAWIQTGRLTALSAEPVKASAACTLGPSPVCGNSLTDFGATLAIDGDILAVGHPHARSIHLYDRIGSLWLPTVELPGPAGFGSALDLQDGILAVGLQAAAEVHVYQETSTGWAMTDVLTVPDAECLGRTVKVSDGRIVAGDPCALRIHVFGSIGSSWAETHTITVPGVLSFGGAIDFEGDRIVTVARPGRVYAIDLALDGWTATQVTTESTGRAVAVSGERVAYVSGDEVHIRHLSGAPPILETRLSPHDGSVFWNIEQFGWSLAFAQATLVVGTPRDDSSPGIPGPPGAEPDFCLFLPPCFPPRPGAAYIFESVGDRWVHTSKLMGDPAGDHRFGEAVALDSDARTVLVGAPAKTASSLATQIDVDPVDSVHIFARIAPGGNAA